MARTRSTRFSQHCTSLTWAGGMAGVTWWMQVYVCLCVCVAHTAGINFFAACWFLGTYIVHPLVVDFAVVVVLDVFLAVRRVVCSFVSASHPLVAILLLLLLLLLLPACRCPAFIINMLPAFVYDAFALFVSSSLQSFSPCLVPFCCLFWCSCWRHKLFLLTHKNC